MDADEDDFSGAPSDAIPDRRVRDPEHVVIFTEGLADLGALLARIAPLGTGDVFCAHAPDDDGFSELDLADEARDLPAPETYSATISDTVATFVVDVARPVPHPGSGADRTAYTISVTQPGPGGQRLRYQLATAVLAIAGADAELFSADSVSISADSLAESPWGRLWNAD